MLFTAFPHPDDSASPDRASMNGCDLTLNPEGRGYHSIDARRSGHKNLSRWLMRVCLTRETQRARQCGSFKGPSRRLLMPSDRAARPCRFFAPELSIIVHDFPHQLFDQLLSDRAVLMAS